MAALQKQDFHGYCVKAVAERRRKKKSKKKQRSRSHARESSQVLQYSNDDLHSEQQGRRGTASSLSSASARAYMTATITSSSLSQSSSFSLSTPLPLASQSAAAGATARPLPEDTRHGVEAVSSDSPSFALGDSKSPVPPPQLNDSDGEEGDFPGAGGHLSYSRYVPSRYSALGLVNPAMQQYYGQTPQRGRDAYAYSAASASAASAASSDDKDSGGFTMEEAAQPPLPLPLPSQPRVCDCVPLWTCRACTLINGNCDQRCRVCDEFRLHLEEGDL